MSAEFRRAIRVYHDLLEEYRAKSEDKVKRHLALGLFGSSDCLAAANKALERLHWLCTCCMWSVWCTVCMVCVCVCGLFVVQYVWCVWSVWCTVCMVCVCVVCLFYSMYGVCVCGLFVVQYAWCV